MVGGGFLADPVGFLRAMGQTVETNIPRSLVATLVEYARKVDRSGTYRAIVTGSKLIRAGFDARGYIFIADFAAIRARADRLFPPPGTLPPEEFLAPKAVAGRLIGQRRLGLPAGRDAEADAEADRRSRSPRRPPRRPRAPAASRLPAASRRCRPMPPRRPTPTPAPEPTPGPTPAPTPAPYAARRSPPVARRSRRRDPARGAQ